MRREDSRMAAIDVEATVRWPASHHPRAASRPRRITLAARPRSRPRPARCLAGGRSTRGAASTASSGDLCREPPRPPSHAGEAARGLGARRSLIWTACGTTSRRCLWPHATARRGRAARRPSPTSRGRGHDRQAHCRRRRLDRTRRRAARAAPQDQRRLPGGLAAPARHGSRHRRPRTTCRRPSERPARATGRDLRRRRDDRDLKPAGADPLATANDQADQTVQIPSAGEEVGARIGSVRPRSASSRRRRPTPRPGARPLPGRCDDGAGVRAAPPPGAPAPTSSPRRRGDDRRGRCGFSVTRVRGRAMQTGEASAPSDAMPGPIFIALTACVDAHRRPPWLPGSTRVERPPAVDRGAESSKRVPPASPDRHSAAPPQR